MCTAEYLDDADINDSIVYYVLLRAVDRFYAQMNRHPGLYDEQVELDIPAVKVSLLSVLCEWTDVWWAGGAGHTGR